MNETPGSEQPSTPEFCPLILMLPFGHDMLSCVIVSCLSNSSSASHLTDLSVLCSLNRPTTPTSEKEFLVGLLATAQLAFDHFNARNGSVVPQLNLPEIQQQCKVQFPPFVFQKHPSSSFSSILNSSQNSTASTLALYEDIESRNESFPCGVVGPETDYSVSGTALLTGIMNIPQMLYSTTDTRLTLEYETTVSPLMDSMDYGRAIVKYLNWSQRFYTVVLVDSVEYQSSLSSVLLNIASEHQMNMELFSFQGYSPSDDPDQIDSAKNTIRDAVRFAKKTGFHTILLISRRRNIFPFLAQVADEEGIVGPSYFWIFSGLVRDRDIILRAEPDSSLDRLLRGASVNGLLDGFDHQHDSSRRGGPDAFLSSWSNVDQSFLQRLNQINPFHDDQNISLHLDSFHNGSFYPPPMSSFLYDSIITLGIASCHRAIQTPQHMVSNQSSQATMMPWRPTLQDVLQTNFTGASGPLSFHETTKHRHSDQVYVGELNIRAEYQESTGLNSYKAVLTSMGNTHEWNILPGAHPFIYHDGTTTPPRPLRDQNYNYLPHSAQIIGLSFMSLALTINILLALWVYHRRNHNLIKASQPIFLYLLCIGSGIMALTILMFSFDEGDRGWSQNDLDNLCEATPWLFFSGYIIQYLTLFSKLWRINQVLQFRRKIVTVRQVLAPFALFLSCGILVLAVWTIQDPFRWSRDLLTEFPFESYGSCKSHHDNIYFSILSFFMIAATLLTASMAWRTRDIPGELSESKWVFYGIFLQGQTWFVGLPILVILHRGTRSRIASYAGFVILIWTFSVSMVALVIGPKVVALERVIRYGQSSGEGTDNNKKSRFDAVRLARKINRPPNQHVSSPSREEPNHVVSPPPLDLSANVIASCQKESTDQKIELDVQNQTVDAESENEPPCPMNTTTTTTHGDEDGLDSIVIRRDTTGHKEMEQQPL